MMDENSAGCASEAADLDALASAISVGMWGADLTAVYWRHKTDERYHDAVRSAEHLRRTLPAPTISQDVPAPAAVTAEMVAAARVAFVITDCNAEWDDFLAAHLNAALSAATPLQSDLAAVETVLLIDELRGDQNADVSLCQDNRVMVSAGWTGMNYRGFSGATLLDSLRAASAARSRAALQGADNHE